MARSPDDPRRRRMAHHDAAGAHARERDGGDGRFGRCALDARECFLSYCGWGPAERADRHPLVRTETVNGQARACSSVDAVRRWASLGCGLVRSMSRLTLLVRASHTPLGSSQLIDRSLFLGGIGPFWAWKVGPATAVNTCAGRSVGGDARY